MDLLTKADVDRIASVDAGHVHISLFIPTHRFGEGVEQDRIRWKNLLVETDNALRRSGMRAPEAAELLAHAWEIHDDALFWTYMSDGFAYYAGPSWRQYFRVPIPLPEVGVIGDRFVVGPILRMLTRDSRFLLLSLSQNQIRMFEGSRYRIDELQLRDVPTSLRDVIEKAGPRSEAMARPAAPQGGHGNGSAVFYGHGAADEHFKKDEVEEFFRVVEAGLQDYLHDEQIPMVLAGVDYLIPIYRQVNSYRHVVPEPVTGNYDQSSAAELHSRAWPIVEEMLRDEERRTAGRVHELLGTGLASTDLEHVAEAAALGRVDTLFIGAEPWCWEDRPSGARVVRLGTEEELSHCELLDRAAVDTMSKKGTVYAVPAGEIPGDEGVAAILRY